MNDDRGELLARLARLQALSAEGNGATDAERAAAQAAISRLLLRHNLSAADIPEDVDDISRERIVKDDEAIVTSFGKDDKQWQGDLVWVLCRYHFCKGVRYVKLDFHNREASGRAKRGYQFTLVGKPSNIAVVKALYTSIMRELEQAGERARKQARAEGVNARQFRNSFLAGAVNKISSRFYEQRRRDLNDIPNANALVIVADTELDDVYNEMFPKLGKAAPSGQRTNLSAYLSGKVAGGAVKIQDEMCGTRTALTGRAALPGS